MLLKDLEIVQLANADYKVAIDCPDDFILSEENLFKLEVTLFAIFIIYGKYLR